MDIATGSRHPVHLAWIIGLIILTGGIGHAEERAELKRKGAGLRIGGWTLQDPYQVAGSDVSGWPMIEGYLQKGIDRHVAVETSLGLWRRTQEIEQSGGLGGTTHERSTTYILPNFTSIKFYPFTRPESKSEPYLMAGAGASIGIDTRSGDGGGLLGMGAENGTFASIGLGLAGGAGIDRRWSEAFGGTAGLRYQWIWFQENLGGMDTYKGFSFHAGVTYRFQYD